MNATMLTAMRALHEATKGEAAVSVKLDRAGSAGSRDTLYEVHVRRPGCGLPVVTRGLRWAAACEIATVEARRLTA